MWPHKYFFIIVIVSFLNIINHSIIYSAKQQAQQPAQQLADLSAQLPALTTQLKRLGSELAAEKENVRELCDITNASKRDVARMDLAMERLASRVASAAIKANESQTKTGELEHRIEKVQGELTALEQVIAHFPGQAKEVIEKSKADFSAHAEEVGKLLEKAIDEAFKKNNNPELEKDKVRISAQIKWEKIKEIISDPRIMMEIAITIVVIALCIYVIKYGLPVLINYLTQPRIISETSSPGLFEWFKPKQAVAIDDLIFTPHLQKQLLDLLLRVQTAKKYAEALPNVLFHGAPGTGKTAFVKALAYESGLDYALTSGSEFAKITDLNHANNELRKLLNWAKRSKNGLIVFIDEAESLFANRKLATTSKATQDFINTFLSLVSDQSQKKVMFIFATNHPFKLDDAITNRVGINIEFTLPEASEREKILSMYLVKSAQENEEAIVDLHPDIIKLLPKYADSLKGFSPRAIKFVAEEMIINARRQESMQLTNNIALTIIDQAIHSLQQTEQWEKERNKWIGGVNVVHA